MESQFPAQSLLEKQPAGSSSQFCVSWVKLGVFSKLKKPSGISSTTMGFFCFFWGGWVLVKLLPDPSKTVDINYFSEALSSHDG